MALIHDGSQRSRSHEIATAGWSPDGWKRLHRDYPLDLIRIHQNFNFNNK